MRPVAPRGDNAGMNGPQRIVCLTEETTEWLYLLGEEHRIVGVSGYAVRPPRVRREKLRVSAFISADFEKVIAVLQQPNAESYFINGTALDAPQLRPAIKAGLRSSIEATMAYMK